MEVVDRSNKPPVWDNLERISRAVYVKENTAVGETVTTVRARSADYYSRSKSVFFLKEVANRNTLFQNDIFVRKHSCLIILFCQLSFYIRM